MFFTVNSYSRANPNAVKSIFSNLIGCTDCFLLKNKSIKSLVYVIIPGGFLMLGLCIKSK
jgi:hypothetical protein